MANHNPQWLSNLFLGLSVCCRISTQRGVSQIAAGFCPSINGELWRGWVALEKYCVMSRATDSKRWPSWDCANPVLFWRVQCSLRILPSNSNKSLSGHGIIFLSFDSSLQHATSGSSVVQFFWGGCCFHDCCWYWCSQSRNVVVSLLTGTGRMAVAWGIYKSFSSWLLSPTEWKFHLMASGERQPAAGRQNVLYGTFSRFRLRLWIAPLRPQQNWITR